MAKRKLSISNVPKDITKKAAKAMDGKQKDIKTEIQKRKDNIEYKTIRINKDLHHQLKMEAVKNQMKITDYIEQILEEGVK